MTSYNIIRFYKNRVRNRKIIYRNVSLEIAQLHCNDESTRKEGVYFDGYELAWLNALYVAKCQVINIIRVYMIG